MDRDERSSRADAAQQLAGAGQDARERRSRRIETEPVYAAVLRASGLRPPPGGAVTGAGRGQEQSRPARRLRLAGFTAQPSRLTASGQRLSLVPGGLVPGGLRAAADSGLPTTADSGQQVAAANELRVAVGNELTTAAGGGPQGAAVQAPRTAIADGPHAVAEQARADTGIQAAAAAGTPPRPAWPVYRDAPPDQSDQPDQQPAATGPPAAPGSQPTIMAAAPAPPAGWEHIPSEDDVLPEFFTQFRRGDRGKDSRPAGSRPAGRRQRNDRGQAALPGGPVSHWAAAWEHAGSRARATAGRHRKPPDSPAR
ncbi:MAG TPA: hypothetical protein VH637_24260 [Streptosporangiaceae bacterium]|jgi:hypothetical protein